MKTFRIRGPTVPTGLQRFDAAVKAFMEKNDLRAGALAVAKDGRLVLAHGYTFGEPNYPITQPTATFRTASATKVLTGVGIYQLIDSGLLKLSDRVADFVNVIPMNSGSHPSVDTTHFFHFLTIEQLLKHQGGWDRNTSGFNEPTFFHDAEIAAAFGHDVPVSIEELISWGLGKPVQFQPGSKSAYSNFGYLLLGLVIAAKRNQTYADAIRKHVLTPLGIRRAFMSRARVEERGALEVKYHRKPDFNVASAVQAGMLTAIQHGGENNANFEGFGGWVMSAPDYVRLLVALDDAKSILATPLAQQLFWQSGTLPLPAGVTAHRHGALLEGAFGVVGRRSDGIALAGFWNTTHTGSYEFEAPDPATGALKLFTDHEVCWHEIANQIEKENAWPAYDLFGQLFPAIERFTATLNGTEVKLIINELHPDGRFTGSILDGPNATPIDGFWEGTKRVIHFLRVVEAGKPSRLQAYTGYFMEAVVELFAGSFQAFAGTGATAKRNVFPWRASGEFVLDTSQITD